MSWTDGNMIVYNDWPEDITVNVENNNGMYTEFPPVSKIVSGGRVSEKVVSTRWAFSSYFDIKFHKDQKKRVTLSDPSTITNLTAEPVDYSNGNPRGMVAPTRSPEHNFLIFDGPGVLPPLLDSAIQANLPAFLEAVVSQSQTFTFGDAHINIEKKPTGVNCAYAAIIRNPIKDESIYRLNIILQIDDAVLHHSSDRIPSWLNGSSVTIKDLQLYLQVEIDLTLKAKPQVTAVQFFAGTAEFSNYAYEGYISIFYGVTHHGRLAFLNEKQNKDIINKLNDALAGPLEKLPGPYVLPERPAPGHKPPHPVKKEHSTWMSNPRIQKKALKDLKLPGTHNSNAYDLSNVLSPISGPDLEALWCLSENSAPVNGQMPYQQKISRDNPAYLGKPLYDFVMGTGVQALARTHDLSILEQLHYGIRRFDFRVYFDDAEDKFYTQHTLRGVEFRNVLVQIQIFIRSHPESAELIFAGISQTNFEEKGKEEKNKYRITRLAQLIHEYIENDHLYYMASSSRGSEFDFQSLADTTIESITAGKTKVMFTGGEWAGKLTNTVTRTSGYAGMGWDGEIPTVKALEDYEGRGFDPKEYNDKKRKKLWAVGWTLAPREGDAIRTAATQLTGVPWGLKDMAHEANDALKKFLQRATPELDFNVVDLDWCNYGGDISAPELIINMNY